MYSCVRSSDKMQNVLSLSHTHMPTHTHTLQEEQVGWKKSFTRLFSSERRQHTEQFGGGQQRERARYRALRGEILAPLITSWNSKSETPRNRHSVSPTTHTRAKWSPAVVTNKVVSLVCVWETEMGRRRRWFEAEEKGQSENMEIGGLECDRERGWEEGQNMTGIWSE